MNAWRRGTIAGLLGLAVSAFGAEPTPLPWQPWSDAAFQQAAQEKKLVLLDLEAVWCHWCHVMDEITYRDPKVVALLTEHYVLVRVDQDSRPDLSNRYEDYGWPATVIFAADGTELVKRQGYVPPGPMARLLEACVADPTPGPSVRADHADDVTGNATLSEERQTALLAQWRDGYDDKAGGWGTSHKFLDGDTVELALRQALSGDARAATMARTTLRLEHRLLDPVWGGVYQYSVGGDWNEPHFEKIIPAQADNLRAYALAFAQWGDAADLAHAQAVDRYLRDFLTSPDGATYTSQDADLVAGEHSDAYFALDDARRRARGIPRIDQHVYARENGLVIAARCDLFAATGDSSILQEAERAARWIVAHRALPDGGFRHDEVDAAGPYLGDTLAMGRAFLALHRVTQQLEWMTRAFAAATFIEAHFRRPNAPGYASSDLTHQAIPAPRPQFDENINLARFYAALAREAGRPELLESARRALQWASAPEVTNTRGLYVGGLLLAEQEVNSEPLHVTVVGAKSDPVARAMFAEALRYPTAHKLVEWWDRREGPAPRGEDIFPDSPTAAAYLCANGACSSPMDSAEKLHQRLNRTKK
ncbi:MAG TPA: DUF255 domain-containing protein [Candidatus Didemnitutus sp.]|nr:DUF255 domain-containing protein [Candidatus Didemnitutus sp.]